VGNLDAEPTFIQYLVLIVPGSSLPSFLLFVALSYLRRWDRKMSKRIMADLPAQEEKSEPRGKIHTLQTSANRTWWSICHKYTRCAIVAADLSWASVVIQNSFRASGGGYVMTYGQLLPLFALAPLLISAAKLCYTYRWELFHFSHSLTVTEALDDDRPWSKDACGWCGLCMSVKRTTQSVIDRVGAVHDKYSSRFVEMLMGK